MIPRFPLLFLLITALGLVPGGAWAQSAPAPAADAAATKPGTEPTGGTPYAPAAVAPAPDAAVATTSSPAASPPEPADTSEVDAALAQLRPKYQPPPPEPVKPVDEYPDLRDFDKPKNQIIRLPKVIVNDKPPPIFSERGLHTSQGLADLALQRYVGASNAMPGAYASITRFLFQDFANQQYQADERTANMAATKDEANMFSHAGDKTESDYLKNASDDAFLQRGDFGTNAPAEAEWTSGYPYLLRTPAGGSGP